MLINVFVYFSLTYKDEKNETVLVYYIICLIICNKQLEACK